MGHGTFVTGLIAAIDGNGIGGKGVAGNTKVLAIRGSHDGDFTIRDLLRGIDFSIRRGADIINMSLAGDESPYTATLARALALAFLNDVLPGGGVRQHRDRRQRAPVPGRRARRAARRPGDRPVGGATDPTASRRPSRRTTEFVSIAAPGCRATSARPGCSRRSPLFTAPTGTSCRRARARRASSRRAAARFAYAQGTSFASPIVAGIAALAWQVEPRLASEQVAEVLIRSARQTVGSGWNEFTGAGIVDGAAATALARAYDVTPPRPKGRARRRGTRVSVRLEKVKDRSERGRELAGHVTYGLIVSRDGGGASEVVVSGRRHGVPQGREAARPRANVLVATACDGNGNCGVKRLGRFKR